MVRKGRLLVHIYSCSSVERAHRKIELAALEEALTAQATGGRPWHAGGLARTRSAERERA